MSRNRNHSQTAMSCAPRTGGAAARAVAREGGERRISLGEARRMVLENSRRAERERLAEVEREARSSYDYKVDE